jgi:hypothetical protein
MSDLQVPLSRASDPDGVRDAATRRERAREFLRRHDSHRTLRETPPLGGLWPMLAVDSVWRNPLESGAEARLAWGIRTHHAIVADEHPDWAYCPRCGEALSSTGAADSRTTRTQ